MPQSEFDLDTTPGNPDYPDRGVAWSAPRSSDELPIRRADGQIDWSRPQPEGTYRCSDGWSDTSGAEYGCMDRATTTCSDRELRCTQHAMIHALGDIRGALAAETEHANVQAEDSAELMRELVHGTEDIANALWEINYSHMSLRRKLWYRLRGWMYERRIQRPTHSDDTAPTPSDNNPGADHAW
jgi:hypothetical protein